MSGLAPLLAGREAPGVRRWRSGASVGTVRSVVEVAGWEFRLLDTAAVADRTEFLDVAGTALELPETWGRNFDALADSLRDLPEGASRGVLVLWESWGGFAHADEQWFEVALEIFAERCATEALPPFAVLLRGPGPELPDVPLLD